MLTVDRIAQIRQLHRDGLSVRQIARQLGHSHQTILKALNHPEPVPYTRSAPRAAPAFDPVRPLVDAILAADETAPRKQRHTASQIDRRLVAEYAYTGSYGLIQRYLKERRLDRRDTFVPLDHRPGHRCEADFGHIPVDFPDGRRLVPVRVRPWSDSNAPFALALPTERTEAILHGMVEAFTVFGGVPREVGWDNPTTVATHIGRGRDRTLHPRSAALASPFTVTPTFGLPATPREKPRVENRVKDLQRMWATPVPRVSSREELNAYLRPCGVTARDRTCGSHAETVGTRFARDLAAALPVPTRPFEACVIGPGSVDKDQTVAFDGNRSSVPRRWAFRPVTVKGFVDRVEVVADHRVVAPHRRSSARGERVLDPLHFLAILEQRPATLDHAPVSRDWGLPPAFAELRRDLETRLGGRAGVRQFIRVLQLLARHPLDRVELAIRQVRLRGDPTAAAVTASVERLARQPSPEISDSPRSLTPSPLPDRSRFNRLLRSHTPEENPEE